MRAVNAPAVEVDGDDILFTQLKSASHFIIPEEIKSFSSVDAEVLIRIVTKSLEIITGSKSEVSVVIRTFSRQSHSAIE